MRIYARNRRKKTGDHDFMRLLIACQQCERQYDATGRAVGTRLRCHCGQAMTVRQPRGHDASVVRCEGCGAPREEGAVACKFCHADFTLRERDLHTVCPKCLSRVSDQARFCHHCGTELNAEMTAGDETALPCPRCESDPLLVSRRMGKEKITVMECGCCAGLWLGTETFSRLAQRTADAALDKQGQRPQSVSASSIDQRKGPLYRKCPKCRKLMRRKNYASRSGVILDICAEDGVWFDADELSAILDWIRGGGLRWSVERQREIDASAERRRRFVPKSPMGSLDDINAPDSGRSGSDWIASTAIDVLFGLFG